MRTLCKHKLASLPMLLILGAAVSWGQFDNATRLRGRNICTNAPTDGQALTWVAASSCWKPGTGGSGTVTTTGSPASTDCAVFSGATSITGSSACVIDLSTGVVTVTGGVTTGSGSGKTGYIEEQGATSGGQGFTVADVAGTATLYVLPTAPNSGKYLKDNGSTTCPTLPSGAPSACEALAWATPALTIASGTASLGTTAVSSGTCSSAIDGGTATGVLTTDTIIATANADPVGITGYTPATTGTLYVWAYPTADHVNLKLCNNTSSSITPGSAVTLNWRVVR